ncbi:MAG TPA: branched-chain amino acid ABC transporter permease [Acidimicrobiales bacterium]|nr:branched-chain amino acid ABC transporter permease [Acidimicrobiales bacterium]
MPNLNETLNGLTNGLIYAAGALALVLIWRATRLVNFAQGAMAMLTTYIALTLLEHGAGYWAAFIAALVSGFVMGAVVERVIVRPVESKPPLNAVILTLGLLILMEAVAGMVWGGQLRSFPSNFSRNGLHIGQRVIAFSHFDIYVVVAVLVIMVALTALFRLTDVGLRMRASAFQPEVARLLGVKVGRMLSLGWALASTVGALAGVLVAPKVFVSPNMMDSVLIFSFTAAILGGLDSPVGALIGGLVLGLGTSFIGGWSVLGPSLEVVGALVLLIVVLMVRPNGLFGGMSERKV